MMLFFIVINPVFVKFAFTFSLCRVWTWRCRTISLKVSKILFGVFQVATALLTTNFVLILRMSKVCCFTGIFCILVAKY